VINGWWDLTNLPPPKSLMNYHAFYNQDHVVDMYRMNTPVIAHFKECQLTLNRVEVGESHSPDSCFTKKWHLSFKKLYKKHDKFSLIQLKKLFSPIFSSWKWHSPNRLTEWFGVEWAYGGWYHRSQSCWTAPHEFFNHHSQNKNVKIANCSEARLGAPSAYQYAKVVKGIKVHREEH